MENGRVELSWENRLTREYLKRIKCIDRLNARNHSRQRSELGHKWMKIIQTQNINK